MDMESISSVNSNYSSTESVKVKSAPVESAHTAAQSVSEASSAVVRTVSESGEATIRTVEAKSTIQAKQRLTMR